MDVVELLIAKGASLNVNAIFNGEVSPLHVAAGLGKKNVLELLLAKGANVNAEDKAGLTPQDWATVMHYSDIAELLRSYGAIGSCRNLNELQSICKRARVRCEHFKQDCEISYHFKNGGGIRSF
jgi:ankyrin repeat protein